MTLGTQIPGAEKYRPFLKGFSDNPWLLEKREAALEWFEKLPVPPLPTRDREFPLLYPTDLLDVKPSRKPPGFTASPRVAVVSLEEAARNLDVVKTYLGQVWGPSRNKWGALNEALWQGGVLVHAPAGVDAVQPILIQYTLDSEDGLAFPRLLVVAEPGSRLILVERYRSTHANRALVVPVIEIVAKENAEVHYVQIQELGMETHHLPCMRLAAGRDTRVTATTCLLGGRRTASHVQASLQGPGAQAQLFGLVLGDGFQAFEHYTLQEHVAPQTESNLLFKVALKDKAYSNFDGLIWIEKGARKTSAFQQNRNLLLSDDAKANATPRLEILDNDVRCTHAAAVGPVDPEQLYYLQSRGLPREEAEALLVEGFFQQVLEQLPVASLREELQHSVSSHLRGT